MATKKYDKVGFGEIQPLLNYLSNAGVSETAAMAEIGYTSSAIHSMRADGEVRKSVKYALLGLIAEKKPDNGENFKLSYNECEMIFDAIRRVRAASPGREVEFRAIQSKIALHMAVLAEKGVVK